MKCFESLPEGYHEIFHIDLQHDKKTALRVNMIALVITVILGVAGHLMIPIGNLFSMDEGLGMYALRFGVLIVGLVAYIILHELIHGITMKHYGCKNVEYGFTGLYAYAGSHDFFPKKPYIMIAMAPIIIWGIVLAIVTPLVPESWFWVVYIIQISNISGAAGDLYVTLTFSRFADDIIVQDYGVGMRVYSKEQAPVIRTKEEC